MHHNQPRFVSPADPARPCVSGAFSRQPHVKLIAHTARGLLAVVGPVRSKKPIEAAFISGQASSDIDEFIDDILTEVSQDRLYFAKKSELRPADLGDDRFETLSIHRRCEYAVRCPPSTWVSHRYDRGQGVIEPHVRNVFCQAELEPKPWQVRGVIEHAIEIVGISSSWPSKSMWDFDPGPCLFLQPPSTSPPM